MIADKEGPTLTITKAPKNKAKVHGTVKVSVRASDSGGIARVELIVNGKLSTVRGRKHTINRYDENIPADQGPYHLPTTETVSVS